MIDRLPIKQRISKMVEHGYSTHRVSNRILNEVGNEIVDAIMDAIEPRLVALEMAKDFTVEKKAK